MKIHLKRLNEAVHFSATNEEGLSVDFDGSPAIGGEGKGVRPMEMVLMAAAACSSIDVISILKKMRQPLQSFSVDAEAMIRPAQRSDALTVAAIQLCSSQAAYGDRNNYLTIERMEHRLKVWIELIDREGVWLDLYEKENVPVAYISFQSSYAEPSTGEITSVYVLPSYWGKGIGKLLMTHEGVDWHEVEEAINQNREEGKKLRGASTITQQTAKNLFLSPKRSFLRKAREFLITKELEYTLSKSRILELYLNSIEFGRGIFGIRSASLHYFSKEPDEMSLFELSRLVAIIPKPLTLSPVEPSRELRWRSRIVLRRLHKYNFVSNKDYYAAREEFTEFFKEL